MPTPLGLPGLRPNTAIGAPSAADRPDLPGLLDRHGRTATDLRVSLTDRCNLRCTYCMPAEGLDWKPRAELLTDAELVRLIRIAVDLLGVDEVRLTGGEPLLRKGLDGIIAAIAGLPRRPIISMTSNGVGLAPRAAALRAAGLDRINISLDSLDPQTFLTLTRRLRLTDVLEALTAAVAAGLAPVKVNAVLIRGVNDHEAADLLDFCLGAGYELRFIEQMPLDAQHGWTRDGMVTAAETFERLNSRFALAPQSAPRGGAPAELFDVLHPDGTRRGAVGIIASVTRPFCGNCDRTRLTADGQLRSCLFAATEVDLRGPLRAGAEDHELAQLWRATMWNKQAGHGIDEPRFLQPARPMSSIGG